MGIKILSDSTINKIAAGEVVERPLSVIKELVENSLDAGARNITIKIERGGRTLISVADDGCGMTEDEVPLSLTRHATSKLDESDITDIKFFGFRGEALPSIASVSNMKIYTCKEGAQHGWEFGIEGGVEIYQKPCRAVCGTVIQVRDLFFSTPSRLKFLKSESKETAACIDLVGKLAIYNKNVNFEFFVNDALYLKTFSEERISDVIGKDFYKNSIEIKWESNEINLNGMVSIPTFNHSSTNKQFFYVNGRPVKDKIMQQAVHISYANLVPHKRYPIVVLFIEIDPKLVDVNVHPTKSEVRFFDESIVKNLIVKTIKSVLENTTSSSIFEIKSKKEAEIGYQKQHTFQEVHASDLEQSFEVKTGDFSKKRVDFQSPVISFPSDTILNCDEKDLEKHKKKTFVNLEAGTPVTNFLKEGDLGQAVFQIDKTYIISQSYQGLVIIDQHAAHERITLEKMKKEILQCNITQQKLLMPIILSTRIIEIPKNNLELMGFELDLLEGSLVSVKAIPSILSQDQAINLLEVAFEKGCDAEYDIIIYIEELFSNIACKNSIKAGSSLNIEEMNSILREMEKTPFASQCNHGRPTYKLLSPRELKRIFERT
ncbi:DNA mismatch repair protein MutL [Candidatus Cyrtobacter comes]|uniref:DNA mismatch repair protein MutL n=1 Tax=Candidatus Cyrtobacter comes TaxID=675776 RepID=A0ABU5L809_9RICK|nr:DNA mismatch repair endonuclease MutL [Candidatus Cyrtobacter comes]MDZ5762263.1 DNA mismatch repair protein MutL [Candidatus Cyrtobacter comes]